MPHRTFHVVLGILGLLAVAALLLARADLARQRTTGPRWKRRLVSAGLVLLGVLGLGSFGAQPGCKSSGTKPPATGGTGGTGGTAPDTKAAPKVESGPFKKIAAVTEEAKQVAAGKRGQYPFDRAGKRRLMGALKGAEADVDALRAKGEINEGEAGLWKKDLQQLARRVAKFRPKEMQRASCYEPMALPVAAADSLARLKARLPLLEKLAAARKLHPRIARKVLDQIEKDLAVLQKPSEVARLRSEEQRKAAAETAGKVARQLSLARAKLGLPPAPGGDRAAPAPGGGKSSALERSAEWQKIVSAWRGIAPLAAASSKATSAQRRAATEKLKAAYTAIEALVSGGRLASAEGALLRSEGERLSAQMYRSPPPDLRVKCYKRKRFIPAEASLERLGKRLPLLERLARAKRLSKAVMSKVVPSIRRDIATLSSAAELRELRDDAARAKAKRAAARAKTVLSRLSKL